MAFVADKCSPYFVGGYESRVLNIAKRLSKRHEVRVYTSLDVDEAIAEGVRFVRGTLPAIRRAPRESRNLGHSAAYSLQLLKSPFGHWNPDVVVIEAIPFAHLVSMERWIRSTGSLVVLNVNEAWFDYPYFPGALAVPSKWVLRHLLKTGIGFSDLVVTISQATARSLRTNYGVRDAVVVPMGLDDSWLTTGSVPEMRTRTLDFLTVGRAVTIKRQEEFLAALALLRRVRGWEGQAGMIGDGPRLAHLRRLARSLGLESQLTFFGHIPEEEKFRLLHDSQAFVLCSEREGFSLATLEAQASHTAVVVAQPQGTDVFGVADLVTDGATGLLYPGGDVSRLAESLDRVAHDHSLRRRLAENAYRQATGYDWDTIVSSLETVLLERLSS
ncbi:MAG: glycosyltransferase family 4 protein [Thermoplasmata archaeon]